MDFKQCQEAYHKDARFHQIVEMLRSLITKLEMSPHEVREVAMFAVCLHEAQNPSTSLMKCGDVFEWEKRMGAFKGKR